MGNAIVRRAVLMDVYGNRMDRVAKVIILNLKGCVLQKLIVLKTWSRYQRPHRQVLRLNGAQNRTPQLSSAKKPVMNTINS